VNPAPPFKKKSEVARGRKLPLYKCFTKPQFYLVRSSFSHGVEERRQAGREEGSEHFISNYHFLLTMHNHTDWLLIDGPIC